MVKLIVLDVDGVITGSLHGINFPYPHEKVIASLRKIRKKGIPIVLCTGKHFPAIEPIIVRAQLNNPHITDGGALIINPVEDKEPISFYVEPSIVSQIIDICLRNKLQIEAFTPDGMLIQEGAPEDYLTKRARINQKDSIIVDSIALEAKKHKVLRLVAVSFNDNEKEKAEEILKQFDNLVKRFWTTNPTTPSLNYCLMTSPNVSKIKCLNKINEDLDIPLKDALGVGDTFGDWEFMNLCGYVATLENASKELKELVQSKNAGTYLIAPSVDDDGILQIFDYFLVD